MKRKAGSVCMAVGLLCLAAAITLLVYNRWEDEKAGRAAAVIVRELESAVDADANDFAGAGDFTGIERTGADAETAGGLGSRDADSGMDTVEIDGEAYIGTLSVPALGLILPIQSEWSYTGMKTAPGRYSGSIWTDDLVICGHNYTHHFGNLKYLGTGDTVEFTDVSGNVFSYQVEEILTLQPTDVEEMLSRESGEWDLTLFTCTTGGQARVTVRCSRTE